MPNSQPPTLPAQAGAAAHEAQIAQGAISNTKQPYSPPISLAKKLDGPLEEMRDLSRNAHNQTKLLEAASTMLHLRAQTLVGCAACCAGAGGGDSRRKHACCSARRCVRHAWVQALNGCVHAWKNAC